MRRLRCDSACCTAAIRSAVDSYSVAVSILFQHLEKPTEQADQLSIVCILYAYASHAPWTYFEALRSGQLFGASRALVQIAWQHL